MTKLIDRKWLRIAVCLALLGALALPIGCKQEVAEATMAQTAASAFKLVGYLPDYRINFVDPRTLGQYYSDIILFSVEPSATGELDSRRLGPAAFADVLLLKQAGVKRVLITCGGGNRSSRFASVTADPALRAKLVASLRALCQSKGLSGVDYDWEHPRTPAEEAAYDALIVETKAAFKPLGLLVTVAVASWQNLSPEALAALDWVNLMAYDNAGEHSTYDYATSASATWLAKGLEPQKLCLGVPFYGRGVVKHHTARTYAQIAANRQLDPLTDHVGDFYFNGASTLARKEQYAQSSGLGGIMVWEVGQDTPDAALARALSRAQASPKE